METSLGKITEAYAVSFSGPDSERKTEQWLGLSIYIPLHFVNRIYKDHHYPYSPQTSVGKASWM